MVKTAKAYENLYEYVYTICITLEANFYDETKHRFCFVRMFAFDGNPIEFASAFLDFLETEKNSVSYKKGTREATIEVINVQIIDKNKFPLNN